MGRQIPFYMVDDDEDEFVEFIKQSGDVAILPQASEKGPGEEYSLFRNLAGRKLGEACHLWNRSVSPEPIIEFIPTQGYYWLDFLQSEVVNVRRSKWVDGLLSMGRLHIENKVLLPNGDIQEKGNDFIKWYNLLCRWIKKRYTQISKGVYISQRVEILVKNGVELTGHRF